MGAKRGGERISFSIAICISITKKEVKGSRSPDPLFLQSYPSKPAVHSPTKHAAQSLLRRIAQPLPLYVCPDTHPSPMPSAADAAPNAFTPRYPPPLAPSPWAPTCGGRRLHSRPAPCAPLPAPLMLPSPHTGS